MRGAGMLLTTEGGLVLLLRRGLDSDHPGTWCCPGGAIEDEETAGEAALRELHEETGIRADEPGNVVHKTMEGGVEFTTFHLPVPEPQVVKLCDEHTAWCWARQDCLPEPLHPGVAQTLAVMRGGVFDRESDVLVTDQLGRTRFVTPEGYLLCEGVRLSATRPMLYKADEIPEIEPANGMVVMNRDADILFADETIASFQGKPITIEHPEELLGPEDWREHSVGVVLAPRRGVGVDDSFLVADLLVTDEDAIKMIEDTTRRCEVSCGYDGEREQVRPGVGRFTRMIGNHVALVERGRCGPACAIGDEEPVMAKQATKRTVIDRLRTAFKAKDEAAFEEELGNASEELEAGGDEPQKVVIELRQPEVQAAGEEAVEKALDPPAVEADEGDDPMVALNAKLDDILTRLAALEGTDERAHEEAAEPDGDEVTMDGDDEDEEKKDDDEDEKKVMDAATVKTVRAEFQDTLARAEVLSPGIKLPSFDSKKSRKTIADSMCGLRRKAMKQALGDSARGKIVRGVIGDADVMKMSCDAMTVAFRASSELVSAKNNSVRQTLDQRTFPQGPMTAERYQQMIVDNRRGGKSA